MNAKTHLITRRAAAKQLGVTAAYLKTLEAEGLVIPERDEKKRLRYSKNMVEQLRPLVAERQAMASGAPAAPAAPAATLPPPSQPVPASPPATGGVEFPGQVPEETTLRVMEVVIEETVAELGTEAKNQGLSLMQYLDRTYRHGRPTPIPADTHYLYKGWAEQIGKTGFELLQEVDEFFRNEWRKRRGSPPEQVYYPTETQEFTAEPSPPPLPIQAPLPIRPAPRYAPRPPSPAVPPYGYGYGYPPPAYPPHPASPVTEAQQRLEARKVELELQRLERQVEAEEAGRRMTAEQRRREAARLQQQKHEDARTAAVLAQREKELENERWFQRQLQSQQEQSMSWLEQMETGRQQVEAQRRAAEHQAASERERYGVRARQAEISQLILDLPDGVTDEQMAHLDAHINHSLATFPPDIAFDTIRAQVDRIAAPYYQATQVQDLRRELYDGLIAGDPSIRQFGDDAFAAADAAIRGALDAMGVSTETYSMALTDLSRIKEEALRPFREEAEAARAAEEAAREAEEDAADREYQEALGLAE